MGLKVTYRNHYAGQSARKEKRSEQHKLAEGQLWKNFRNGSEEAYTAIYKEYFFVLYNYGRQFTNDHELVKDCIHDLFINLWFSRENLGDTDSIKFYLFRCLRREINKKVSGSPFVTFEKNRPDKQDFEIVLPIEAQMIAGQDEKENIIRLRNAVNSLSDRQREIIFLMFYENLSHKQISSILNIKVKTVYNLISKAIRSLQKYLIKTLSILWLIIQL